MTLGSIKGEVEYTTVDDPITPLLGGTDLIEYDETGDHVFVAYTSDQGISIIDRVSSEITHLSTPDIGSDNVYLMEYIDEDNVLIFITGTPYTATNTNIEFLWISDGTLTKIPLSHIPETLYDMEYDPASDTLYLATDTGIWIIDTTTGETTSILDDTSGLLSASATELFLEPQEGILWALLPEFSSIYLQGYDISSGSFLSESFDLWNITQQAGFTPNGMVDSFTYNPVHREFFVSMQINTPTTYQYYYLYCFDRDDTIRFAAVDTGVYVSTNEARSDYSSTTKLTGTGLKGLQASPSGDDLYFNANGYGPARMNVGGSMLDSLVDQFMVNSAVETSRAIEILFEVNERQQGVYDEGAGTYGEITVKAVEAIFYYAPDVALSFIRGEGFLTTTSGIATFDLDDLKDTPQPQAQQVDMVSLYMIEKGEEDDYEGSEDVDGDTRLGPRDMLHVSAYAPYGTGVTIDHMELRIIKEPGGEVVYEKKEMGAGIYHEQDVKELPTSRYTIKVLAKDAQGSTIYKDESTFYVDNPVSKPVVGSVVGAGIALTASLGAGIAISAMGAGATSAAGGAASSAAAGAGSSVSSSAAGSAFSWKNLLFGFASEYGEEALKEKTAPKDRFLDLKGSFITKREVMAMLISVIVLVIGFGYVEMMSALSPNKMIEVLGIPLFTLPNFSLSSFFMVVPVVFFTSVMIILAIELVEELSAKMIGLWSEFRIWPIGLLTLLISSLFLMPIGYPGKAVPKGEVKITNRMEVFIASCVLFSILAMMFPFEIAFLIGDSMKAGLPADLLTSFGMIGITMCVMMFAYSVFPIVPMDGRKLWKFNKFYLIVMLLFGITTFGLWSFRLLPNPLFWRGDYVIYIPTWVLATLFMVISSLAMIGLIGLVILGFTVKNWDDPEPKKKSRKRDIEE